MSDWSSESQNTYRLRKSTSHPLTTDRSKTLSFTTLPKMSLHESTFQQLKDMGIDAPLARAAALRFSTTDAAVNWCFGEGQSVSPCTRKI